MVPTPDQPEHQQQQQEADAQEWSVELLGGDDRQPGRDARLAGGRMVVGSGVAVVPAISAASSPSSRRVRRLASAPVGAAK